MSRGLVHAVVERIKVLPLNPDPELPALLAENLLEDNVFDTASAIIDMVHQYDVRYNFCKFDTCIYWDQLPEGQCGCIPAAMYDVLRLFPIANSPECPCYEREPNGGE